MSTSKTNKTARPHRRLSLTMPTEVAAVAPALEPVETTPEPEAVVEVVPPVATAPRVAKPRPVEPPVATGGEEPQTVRVMSYLTEDEAGLLDELWLQFRRTPQRPSKSDIMRAALALAGKDREALLDVITTQQISTLTRQRSSKIGSRRGER